MGETRKTVEISTTFLALLKSVYSFTGGICLLFGPLIAIAGIFWKGDAAVELFLGGIATAFGGLTVLGLGEMAAVLIELEKRTRG